LELSNFHGIIKYKNDFGKFVITKTYYSPGLLLKEHLHRNPILSIILLGSLTETYQNFTCKCNSKSILYKPALEKHENIISKNGCHCLNIEFSKSFIQKLRKNGFKIDQVMTLPENKNNSIIIRLQNELKISDYYSVLALEGIIMEMFAELYRHKYLMMSKKYPDWFNQVLKDMEKLHERDITIEGLADNAGIHPAHLIKTFKKYFRITPAEYMRQKKISLVCEELLLEKKSLIQIALEQNFSDQSHFNKFFKKYTGITPSQYRILHSDEIRKS